MEQFKDNKELNIKCCGARRRNSTPNDFDNCLPISPLSLSLCNIPPLLHLLTMRLLLPGLAAPCLFPASPAISLQRLSPLSLVITPLSSLSLSRSFFLPFLFSILALPPFSFFLEDLQFPYKSENSFPN